MKTPIYETSGGALEALLDTNSFVFADLYTYTLTSGQVLRYTTADFDITFNGHLFSAGAPYHQKMGNRSLGHWKIGLDVDTWQVGVMPRLIDPITGTSFPDTIGNQPWLQAASLGALDDALVEVDRVYSAAWPVYGGAAFVITGALLLFLGHVAAIDIDGAQVIVSINDQRQLLTTLMPRLLYQSSCVHTLYDIGCTLTAASFKRSSTVGAGSTNALINSSVAAPPGSGTYTLGRMVMTSGNNNTFQRAIRLWNAGTSFQLIAPFPYNVTVGDTFDVYAGCDKKQTTCALFSNSVNFGGQPYIPQPEIAV